MIIGCTFFLQRFNTSFMSVKRKPVRNALNDIYETYSICINILQLMRFNFKKNNTTAPVFFKEWIQHLGINYKYFIMPNNTKIFQVEIFMANN